VRRGLGLGVEDLRVEVVLLGQGDGRLEVLVLLGVAAHHIGLAGQGGGLGAGLAVLAPVGVGLGDGAGGSVAACEGAAEERANGAPDAPRQGRDRGPGEQHSADDEQQDGDDASADLAEEVGEPGFDAVADLAPFPTEEEDEDQVDAEGDEKERDQVEVALLQGCRQTQSAPGPGFGFRLPFGGSFASAGRSAPLLTHEHGLPFDVEAATPAS
jgi:hypothetical protein